MQTPDLLEEIAQTRAEPLQIECQRPDGSRTMCTSWPMSWTSF